jgi:glycosyltransferase involved in cell wall biosynthesis
VALIQSSDRAALHAELKKFLRRTLRRLFRLGPRKLFVLISLLLSLGVVALFGSVTLAVILGVVGVFGGLIATLGLEVWRSRRMLTGLLQRMNVRGIPGARSYEQRSSGVVRLAQRYAQGHESLALRSLNEIMTSTSSSEAQRRDAACALIDMAILAGDAERARGLLDSQGVGSDSAESWAFRIETAVMLGDLASVRVPPRPRRRMARDPHWRFLLANTVPFTGTGTGTGPSAGRLGVLNDSLRSQGFGPVESVSGQLMDLTSRPATRSDAATSQPPLSQAPLVSILVPAYNSEQMIGSTLRSLLAQTWPHLEILVVDDLSTDSTVEVVRQIAAEDSRIRLLQRTENGGAYRARNTGLAAAEGEFITVSDADDWSHCEKISAQVRHLIDHPTQVATISSWVRATSDLQFVRRGLPHTDLIGINYSSMMIRRTAIEKVGAWDEVVVEGDSEMLGRLRSTYGRDAVTHLYPMIPLAVGLRTSTSLSQSGVTDLRSHRHAMGVRKIYGDAYRRWHASADFQSDLPLQRRNDFRPFVAPPLVRRRGDRVHEMEVVVLSDLCLPGGTTASNLTEIAANERHGLRTGLIHNRDPRFRDQGINPKFLDAHSALTRVLTVGEQVSCDVLVIKYPPSALELPDLIPEITVRGQILLAVNQSPMTGYTGDDRRVVYHVDRVDAEIRRLFGRAPLWAPVGPSVRAALCDHHRSQIDEVEMADEDWVEIIDGELWRRSVRPEWAGDRPIRIGRHGRDSEWKWPSTKADILEIYPADPRYEVRILGGADVARDRMGSIPHNWQVLAFDEVSPADWLSELDVFVSFPHPDMVEAFGRTLLEALAVGVPVVTDTRFGELFGDAVIACTPDRALHHVDALMADAARYEEMVQRGSRLVQERFGYDAHLRRLVAMGLQR